MIRLDLAHPHGFTEAEPASSEKIPRLENAPVDLDAYRSHLRLVQAQSQQPQKTKRTPINFSQAAAQLTHNQVLSGDSNDDKSPIELPLSLLGNP